MKKNDKNDKNEKNDKNDKNDKNGNKEYRIHYKVNNYGRNL